MLSSEYCEAAVEVLGILNELEGSEFNKIPKKIIEFLENNKSKSYKPSIDFSEDVNKMVLKDKTRDILAGIYLDYLCKESEKQKFIDTIRKNALKYQEKIKEQYKTENLFKPKEKQSINTSAVEVSMVNYKEPFFKKLFDKLQRFFGKK